MVASGKKDSENLVDRKILVVGAGISGLAAALVAKKFGADVTLCDAKKEKDITANLTPLKEAGIKFAFEEEREAILDGIDEVIVSPAVPCRIPLIRAAYSCGIKVESEIEMAFHFSASPIFAITGTNGKTTTVTLTGDLFKEKYGTEKTGIGGNIGTPLIDEAIRIGENGAIIAEISSYQMEATNDFHPHIAAILNITPDHLTRHGSFKVYREMKEKIFAQMTENDYLVLNHDDPETRDIAKNVRLTGKEVKVAFFSVSDELACEENAAFLRGKTLYIRLAGKEKPLVLDSELQIKGRHNIENALAAALIAALGGINVADICRVLKKFQPVEHRIEPVRKFAGVMYYNDSKATNTDSSIKALESFVKDDGSAEPIILIAGGDDKMTDLTDFMQLVKKRCKKLILVGKATERFHQAAISNGIRESDILEAGFSMEKAVELAHATAVTGDVVLLSPACASYDMFTGYEERGRVFKRIVNELK